MDPAPQSTREAIAELDHRLAGLIEPTIRTSVVREWARQRSPAELYTVLCHVLGRPPQEASARDALREALHEILRETPDAHPDALSQELRLAVYAHASEAHDALVCRLLRPTPAARAYEDPATGLPRELADVPLGRRRSLARAFDRRLLEQLARDPDPTVIRNLLHNPRIRESDVQKLACMRPAAASTLEAIGSDARWSQHPCIRSALAQNPYTPVPLALQMLNGLCRAELREIEGDGTLHGDVRAHAASLLSTRS